jgi:S-formylglutathione hydrolase FrmB
MSRLVAAALAGIAAVVVIWAVLAARSPSTGAASEVTVARYEVESRFVHRALPQTAMLPPGEAAGRPLLVFLHGRGKAGARSNANRSFAAALRSLGTRAPVVVFPNGGEHSYFHARRSGDWGRYVLDEVIPRAVARFHADPDRVAIGGISMGGFGAFAIARRRPSRFCAVGGHSAALWLRSGDSAPGAFDDAADFRRNDLIRLARARGRKPWGGARLWLDGGRADPFRAAGDQFAAALGIRMRHPAGGHTGEYWHRHYKRYLRFYADALAAC